MLRRKPDPEGTPQGGGGAPQPPEPGQKPAPADKGGVTPPAGQEPAPASGKPDDIASLPAWAQKVIHDTREEAGTHRTKAKTANDTLEQTRNQIAQALGLKGEDDPVKAAQTAAEERDAARSEAKAVKAENMVIKAALKLGADPDGLTDSRTFMAQLATLDPASDEFSTDVSKLITEAIAVKPNLKTASPPPYRSGGPISGGQPPAGQLTSEDIKGWSPEAIVKAKEEGRLNSYLGIEN